MIYANHHTQHVQRTTSRRGECFRIDGADIGPGYASLSSLDSALLVANVGVC